MSQLVYSHLQPSINLGLSESQFWEMTLAEIGRWQEGAIWRLKSKAQFDYILADLIGISADRMVSKDVEYPTIEDVYPNLFEKEIEERDEEAEIATNNINRFMEFAQRHNSMMKKGEEDGS